MHVRYARRRSHTAGHHAAETASGQRARGSATHKGHRRIASSTLVDPQAVVEVWFLVRISIEMENDNLLTGMTIWVVVMSKTRIWRVVLAWSHDLELGDLFSRCSPFRRTRFQAQRFW
jgi:hypothetical protein